MGALQPVLPAVRRLGPVRGHRASLAGEHLLDCTTNGDVEDLGTPLSHAALTVDHLGRLAAHAS